MSILRRLTGWIATVLCATSLWAAQPPVLPAGGICAHRGGGALFPENTVPALREAVRRGAQMVEFDLALTKDGELVLMHDRTVDRTTNGKGKVSDLTLAELRQLDAGAKLHPRFAGTRVPTLAEALAVLPRDLWLNFDIKSDGRFGGKDDAVARRVAELVIAESRRHQSVLAVRTEGAAVLRREFPGVLICSMDRRPDPADYVREAIAQKADFIQLRDCATDPRLAGWLKALRAAGVRINYFYTNNPAEAARFRGLGVDFVLVDDLDRVPPAGVAK